jgi:hypothetical protein
MNMNMIFIIFSTILAKVFSAEQIYNIIDFRSNPMGISQKEAFFRVNLGVPDNSRILAYADFNNDK